MINVDVRRVGEHFRAADLPTDGARQVVPVQNRFDGVLDSIGELVAVTGKNLDSVVLDGIVRRRNYHPGRRGHAARQVGDGRRRQDAAAQHGPSCRTYRGSQRGLEHRPGQTGVPTEQKPRPGIGAQHVRRGAAEPEDEFGSEIDVRDAADTVRPKQPAHP